LAGVGGGGFGVEGPVGEVETGEAGCGGVGGVALDGGVFLANQREEIQARKRSAAPLRSILKGRRLLGLMCFWERPVATMLLPQKGQDCAVVLGAISQSAPQEVQWTTTSSWSSADSSRSAIMRPKSSSSTAASISGISFSPLQ
jgi:hypothetical protein